MSWMTPAPIAPHPQVLESRRMAMRKRDECQAKLRDLGALPSEEQAAVEGKKKRELIAMLAKVNEGMKAYNHVNKKAAEQHASFADEREALRARKVELDRADASIRDLIATLDARKDEAILRTFKGVAKHFSEVFSELVPKGAATMTIQTEGLDGEQEESEIGDAEEPGEGNESHARSSPTPLTPRRCRPRRSFQVAPLLQGRHQPQGGRDVQRPGHHGVVLRRGAVGQHGVALGRAEDAHRAVHHLCHSASRPGAVLPL